MLLRRTAGQCSDNRAILDLYMDLTSQLIKIYTSTEGVSYAALKPGGTAVSVINHGDWVCLFEFCLKGHTKLAVDL